MRRGDAGPLKGAWWKIASGLIIAYVIYGAFFIAKGVVGFGQSGNPARIVFFHVPAAILSYVCYAVATVYGILYLTNRGNPNMQVSADTSTVHLPTHRNLDMDTRAGASMELGFLFCILATVTGSIFAGVQWGSFWNWDPRETSIVIMLLLYGSYLVLRTALAENPDKRARLAAVYSIVALVPATFLIWVVPRLPGLGSLHPGDTLANPDKTSWTYKGVLYPSFLGFTLLYIWLLDLRCQLQKLKERRQKRLEYEQTTW